MLFFHCFSCDCLLSVQFCSHADFFEMFLSICDVFTFLDGHNNARCVTEGEKIIRASHIIKIGIIEETDEIIKIFALVLQTSHLLDKPHEIAGTLLKTIGSLKIECFKCSCKAGAGSSCKHIAAVLFFCQQ